jgi:hypothetical protein
MVADRTDYPQLSIHIHSCQEAGALFSRIPPRRDRRTRPKCVRGKGLRSAEKNREIARIYGRNRRSINGRTRQREEDPL